MSHFTAQSPVDETIARHKKEKKSNPLSSAYQFLPSIYLYINAPRTHSQIPTGESERVRETYKRLTMSDSREYAFAALVISRSLSRHTHTQRQTKFTLPASL